MPEPTGLPAACIALRLVSSTQQDNKHLLAIIFQKVFDFA